MNGKNLDFVAIDEDFECLWRFTFASIREGRGSRLEQSLSGVRRFFDALDGFIRPLQFSYQLSSPESADSADGSEGSWREVSSESGISWSDVAQDARRVASSASVEIVGFEVEHAAVRISLADGDYHVDRHASRCKRWETGEVVDAVPWFDPLSLKLRPAPSWTAGTEGMYRITVESHTELWFEDTDVAERNRVRLAEFLDRIRETFHPTSIECRSNWRSEEELDAVLNQTP